MNFRTSVKTCLSKYFTISGRASRSEFWWFQLFVLLVGIALTFVDQFVFGAAIDLFWPFADSFSLLMLFPCVTVGVRRLHDIDRTGWWSLLWLVLLIGWIILAVFHILKGTDGENRFGQDPLA